MRTFKNSNPATESHRRGRLRQIHRWLGIGSAVVIMLLSVTGVALNHSAAWRLDQTYLAWPWLLDWYGIEAPEPLASYLAGEHRVTLLGARLYLDEREIAEGVFHLTGAVATAHGIAVSMGDSVLFASLAGQVVERVDVNRDLPNGIDALGVAGGRLVYRSAGVLYQSDEELLRVEPWDGPADHEFAWSMASDAPAEQVADIQRLYRGRGVSAARLLSDLHSGRLFTRFGPLIMDAAGAILVVLAMTGLIIWSRRNGPTR